MVIRQASLFDEEDDESLITGRVIKNRLKAFFSLSQRETERDFELGNPP